MTEATQKEYPSGGLTPNQKAAHDFLSELRTRISVQPLPYQSGVEARALESLWELFALARKAMKNNPGCEAFAHFTSDLLNLDVRPITAKWHRAHVEGRLASRDGADEFRGDLAALRITLRDAADRLHRMAYGEEKPFDDEESPPVMRPRDIDACFEPVPFGITEERLIEQDDGHAKIKDINDKEKGEVDERRIRYGLPNQAGDDVGLDAIGLALSGGGIRSATFCLGAIQVMAERKLLKDVDFLSTVSGGGYTGSFLSRRLGRLSPCATQHTAAEIVAIQKAADAHAAAKVAANAAEPAEVEAAKKAAKDAADATVAAVSVLIGKPRGPDPGPVRYLRQNAKYLAATNLWQAWSMVTATLGGLLLNWTAPLFVVAAAALLTATFLVPYWQLAWTTWTLTGLLVFSAIGLVCYGYLMRKPSPLPERSGKAAGVLVAATVAVAGIWLLTELYHLFMGLVLGPHKTLWQIVLAVFAAASAAGPTVMRFVPILQNPKVRDIVLKVLLVLVGFIIPLAAIAVFYLLVHLGDQTPLGFDGRLLLLVLVIALGLVAVFVVNINLTGPHRLYRDQLARTFVQRTDKDTAPKKLEELNPDNTAPYHLINTTLNVPSSGSTRLRDRKSDFFLFSKHYCGAPVIGYRATKDWRANSQPVDLATAMAVSGAAFSSNMGLGSIPPLRALLTFLNVRLGFWIRKPGGPQWAWPGFFCLMREMTGTFMSEDRYWFNLSDGGHIENMAVYELLRRRCKFIVSIDGEADPACSFHGHLTLVRHAQIDFGVRIDTTLDDLRPDTVSKFSKTHYMFCRIHYPATVPGGAEEIGLLLYVKLSTTGDEAELIKRYRLIHPDFPHQTTLDQFFDEEQFEAYRQLGAHVMGGLFSPAITGGDTEPGSIPAWFRALAQNLLEPVSA